MNDFRLSDEQRLVVTSEKKDLLVIAPPGCGKTEVLAHRAAQQIDSLERNQKVLALTFTNRARLNLEERLRSVLGYARGRRHRRSVAVPPTPGLSRANAMFCELAPEVAKRPRNLAVPGPVG